MKQTNRLLGLLLTVVMLMGMLPTTAFAAEHTHDYTSSYTHIDGSKQHYGVCSCGESSDTAADCVYPDEVPAWNYSPNATREGKRTWECILCSGEWEETVPAHDCTKGDVWVEDDYRYHSTSCTFPGCGGWMGESHDAYMTGDYHKDAITISNDCTRCGRSTSYTIEASLTTVDAKEATCKAPGNLKFYICTHCDKYFADENCQHEVTPAEVYINPLEHNYVNGVCSECGYEIKQARFAQSLDDTFSSDDRYLYVLIGVGSDGKLYAMGEAANDGKRYGVAIPNAQIDENGIITLTPEQAEFMDFEYYFENGSGASTTSTFIVDGNYMTARYGAIYTFPQNRLDDKNNPRPFAFRQANYGDESGLGYVYCDLYDPSDYSHTNEYITFNADTHYFEVCSEKQDTIYLYRQVCDHDDIDVTHSFSVAPTCTEQGYGGNYWYCSKCYKYFTDEACTTELVLPDYVNFEEYFNAPALGHKFAANGVCENCGMKRNVYTPVTSLEQFDQLSEEAYYIIVFKDGDKTYAAYYPDVNAFDQMVSADSDGDGVVDLLETDANANGIPDIIENYIDTQWSSVDYNEDGVKSAEEYNEAIGSYDEDEDVDIEDYKLFFSYDIEYWLYDEFWEENAINHPNIVEVTVASDGSITVTDEGAMEFQMMVGGVWGSQSPLGDDYEYDYEYFGILDTERMRAAWIPNYWIGASGQMGYYGEEYFMTQERFYGDGEYPGIIDHKNWKISFREDGTACLVNSWTDLEDTGALQLAKYTDSNGNTRMTIVGLPEWQWEYSDIMLNRTALLPAYLYASEPTYAEPPHECVWGPWEDDDVTETHTRWCTVDGCTKKQTEDHNWDDGVQTSAPSCTETGTILYTCPDCSATKTEPIDALDHDWSEWVYDSVDSHIRHCKRDGCDAEEYGGHEWGDWVAFDDDTHKMTCSICKGYQTEEHDWDDGVVTKEPTEWEEGVKTYTCGICSHTKTEPIDKLVHECVWTDWYPNGDENHKRDCMDDNCDKFETLPHEWDNGEITKEPTCKETGVKTYTCQTCMHTRTEDVPTTDHVFGDWTPNNDGTTHSRFCSCNESETADHKFDDGVVTEQPTHVEPGIKTYICADCGYSYEEDIPVLTDHAWGEWVINKLDEANTHIRYCICDESQTAPHNFDEGVVTTEATHTSKGVKTFTCTDGCGYSYTEEIPTTPDHEWTDWSPSSDGTHTRACRCNANETKDCEWDNGVVTAPTCEEDGTTVYTCTVCGNTKTDTTPALDHDWGDWIDTGANAPADIHERSCKRDGCNAKETGNHEWSSWTSTGSSEHKKTCSVCEGERTATHAWDNGVETKTATVKETGTRKYTCSDCGATKTEVIPKIVCDHTWGKWETENDETHKHTCVNGNGCEAFQRQAHEWDNGVVTTEPTETAEGVRTYTCLTCSHEKTEAIAMLEHTHSFGRWTSDGEDTHTRRCENGNTCTAAETEPHSCDAWANNEDGTHSGKCSVCGAEIVEAHTWGDWEVQDGGSLKRTCTAECGASEELPVLQPITDSVVTTTSNKNDASAELKDDAVVLFNNVLTDDEQKAVAEGNATVSIYLEVTDIPANEVSSSDKAAAEAVIEEEDNALDETTEIGMYLDINLFKEVTITDDVTSKTETEASQVTETSSKVTITIQIPDELIDDSVNRTYRIIRVHEDEDGNLITDVIEGIFDPVAKTFTFETDKFSTYALAYNDSTAIYTITFNANGGTVSPASAETDADGKVSLPTPTRNGSYSFKGWYTAASGGTKITSSTVFNEDTTIYAQWTYTGGGDYVTVTYAITVADAKNGDVSVSPIAAVKGTTVTITVDPDKGYTLETLAVTDKSGKEIELTRKGDGKYTFEMPASKVTVTATFMDDNTMLNFFVDVPADAYYYDAVLWAIEEGVTNGTSATTFSPNASCTRAQMVTFLWRAAGSPEPKTTECKFTDVNMDSYYGKAVLWAVEQGVTNGTSDSTFSPDATCTRAQIATFLCRMADGKPVSSTNAFNDVKADAYYADSVQWAFENGITNGTDDNKFSPDAICTRAQMVTFLYRYFVK